MSPIRLAVAILVADLSHLAAQSAGGSCEQAPEPLVDLQAAHYAAVEEELSAADTSALTPAQREARCWVIEDLARYRTSRVFGFDPDADARVPAVRDEGGRLCAVAQIVWDSGAHELIDRLAATDNHGWIVQLLADPELGDWAARMGVTPAELARIHAPAVPGGGGGGKGGGGGGGSGPSWGGGGGHGGGKASKPQDSQEPTALVPGKPKRGASAPASKPAAGAKPATGSLARTQALGTGGASLDPFTGGEAMDDWWLWWEINKTRYLISRDDEARAADAPLEVTSVQTGMETASQRRARLGGEVLPLLRDALVDDAACVRAAASTTLGRLGGDGSVDLLLPALTDPSMQVREATLLALGATGSARAAVSLLHVAEDGTVPGGTAAVGPSARPLAVMALGLSRRRGLDPGIDSMVAGVADQGEVDVEEAGLLFDGLTGAQACDPLASRLASERSLDIRLRCRVTEALDLDDGALLPAALDELGAADVDRRRAAAVALARGHGEFTLPQLQTAFELEEEPLTRGLLLLSIGEQGGDAARTFLQRELRRGHAIDQPWVALALGLVGRTGDEDARKSLRDGLHDGPPSSALGAWLLACGLGRDPQAAVPLREALAEAADPRDRMLAALSLSMLRDKPSLQVLRDRLDVESAPLARAGVLMGIALFGYASDAQRLVAEVRTANDPQVQAQLAAALGVHDTSAAADGLVALLREPDGLSDVGRAAAIEALGLLLDPNESLQLVHAAAGRNFAVFPDWLARALTTTTL